MKKLLILLAFLVLVLAACGSPSTTQNPTQDMLSYTATAALWTSTPDFTGKPFLGSADLYAGPGESYPIIGSATGSVKIIGQADGCSWFQVVSLTDNLTGWLRSNQVIYTVQCADVPGAQVPPSPQPTATSTFTPSATFTLIPTATFTLTPPPETLTPVSSQNTCTVESAMTIGNDSGATTTFTLNGPDIYKVTLLPGWNTRVDVCKGCYNIYISSGGCGGTSGSYMGRYCDGAIVWLRCAKK